MRVGYALLVASAYLVALLVSPWYGHGMSDAVRYLLLACAVAFLIGVGGLLYGLSRP